MPMHDPQLWRMEKVLPLLYFSPSLSLSVETISSGGVDCGTLNAANRLLIAAFLHLSPEPWDGVEEVEPRNCCRPAFTIGRKSCKPQDFPTIEISAAAASKAEATL